MTDKKEKVKKDDFEKMFSAYSRAMKSFHKGDYEKAAEQIKDFINDSKLDHTIIKEIFGIEFQHVDDFLKKSVPIVKASMAKQEK